MFESKLSPIDRILVGVSLLGALTTAYCLYDEHIVLRHFLPVQEGKQSIGVVEIATNDVRRRLSSSLLWYGVSEDEVVYERDSIFTGPDSETWIRFSEDVGFKMGPNSLVILSVEDNQLKLDLQLGSLIAEVKQGKTFKLQGDGEEATLRGQSPRSEISITKEKTGILRLASASKPLEIELSDGVKKVDTNQVLKLDRDLKPQEDKNAVDLLVPSMGHLIWHDPSKEFSFRWKYKQPVKNPFLQVSKDRNFSTVLYERKVDGEKHMAQGVQTQGQFYWRIVQKETEAVFSKSDTNVFRLGILKSPEMYIPKQNEVIQSSLKKGDQISQASVQFLWERKLGVKSYHFQLSKDQAFQSLVVSEEVLNSYIKGMKLPKGDYYWRVRVSSPAMAVGNWPSPHRFKVDSSDQVPLLIAENQQNEVKPLRPDKGQNGIPSFRELDMSKLGEATSERDISLSAPQLTRADIKTLLKFDRQLNSREPAAVKKAIQNPPQFQWEEVVGANAYEIEISKDEEFKQIVEEQSVKNTTYKWRNVKVGDYYWRVGAKQGSQTRGPKSLPARLKVGLESPILDQQIKRTYRAKNPSDFLKMGPPIGFQWKSLPMTEKYKLLISEEGTDQPLVEKILDNPEAQIDLQKPGRYEVRVAALDGQGRQISPYSEPSKLLFEKIYEFKRPQILFPADGTTVVTFGTGRTESMILDWRQVEGAKNYRIQFSKGADFQTLLLDKLVDDDQYFVSDIIPQGLTFWRVRAEYDSLSSEWTHPRRFEIQAVKQ